MGWRVFFVILVFILQAETQQISMFADFNNRPLQRRSGSLRFLTAQYITAVVMSTRRLNHTEKRQVNFAGLQLNSFQAVTLCRQLNSLQTVTLCRQLNSLQTVALCRQLNSLQTVSLCRQLNSLQIVTYCRQSLPVSRTDRAVILSLWINYKYLPSNYVWWRKSH